MNNMSSQSLLTYYQNYPFIEILLSNNFTTSFTEIISFFDAESQNFLLKITSEQIQQILTQTSNLAFPPTFQTLIQDSQLPGTLPILQQNSSPKLFQIQQIIPIIRAKVPPNTSILDAGCGVGKLSASLASQEANFSVLGVDRNEKLIEKASLIVKENLTFTCTNINPKNLPNATTIINLHGCGDFGADIVEGVESQFLFQIPCCYQAQLSFPRSQFFSQIQLENFDDRRNFLNVGCGSYSNVDVELLAFKRTQRAAMQPLLEWFSTNYGLSGAEKICKRSRSKTTSEYLQKQVNQLKIKSACEMENEQIIEVVYGDFNVFWEKFLDENLQKFRIQTLLCGVCCRNVELIAVADRVEKLKERGYGVTVQELCGQEYTPRNLLIVAERIE